MFCIKCGTEIPNDSKFCTKCGKPLDEEKVQVRMNRMNSVKKFLGRHIDVVSVTAVMLVVVISAVGITNNFISSVTTEEMSAKEKYNAATGSDDIKPVSGSELEELLKDIPVVEGLHEPTNKPRNEKKLRQFVENYGGVWYITKEYDKIEGWKYYELGKKLMLFAWNTFNDYSYTPIVGSTTKKRYKELYVNGRLVDSTLVGTDTTFIYGETQHYDGFDIDYEEKFIVLMDDQVDLSGLGGPVFSMEDFRYENIGGKDYLISDIYGFALMWDGTYLEYCEPDTYGHYQGYYAFRYYNINALISEDEGR